MPQQAGIAAQAAPPLAPQNQPVPLPRNRAPLANLIAATQPAPINAAPIGLIQPAPPPAPAPLPVNHVTPQENLLSALDEW